MTYFKYLFIILLVSLSVKIYSQEDEKRDSLKTEREEEEETSSAAPVNIEDCRAMWEKFKKGLSANYPFLYELVVDLPICFDDGNVWSLKIKGSEQKFALRQQKIGGKWCLFGGGE